MSLSTNTTTTTPPVPAEIHLTPAQAKIHSLLRSTALRLSLNTTRLCALRHEETLLLAILPPVRHRTLSDLRRVNAVGEKILLTEKQRDEDEGKKVWLEEVLGATVE